MMSTRIAVIALSMIALALAGCSYDLESVSGARFQSAYTNAELIDNPRIDRRIRGVLEADSTLRFPSRIGLARISDGDVTEIPAAEADSWASLEARLGPEFGTFVPLDPQFVEMAAPSPSGTSARNPMLHQVVERVRLGAAQQQLAAMLIYEIDSLTQYGSRQITPVDVTIVGAFVVPTRGYRTTVSASALLVDVLNGRPHGAAGTQAAGDGFTTLARTRAGPEALSGTLSELAVARLAEDVEQMMRAVKREMDLAGATE